jgi:hypothetical protein
MCLFIHSISSLQPPAELSMLVQRKANSNAQKDWIENYEERKEQQRNLERTNHCKKFHESFF